MSKYYDKEQLQKECTIKFEKQIPIVIGNKTYYCDIEVIKLIHRLNNKIELLEYNNRDTPKEDKKIEKLENLNTDYFMERKKYGTLTNEEIVLDIQTLKNYINEIIDKVNGE